MYTQKDIDERLSYLNYDEWHSELLNKPTDLEDGEYRFYHYEFGTVFVEVLNGRIEDIR